MSDPLADAIDAEIASRAETGFTEEFTNGGHRVRVTPLAELLDAQERLERRAAAKSGGSFRLAQFDPYL